MLKDKNVQTDVHDSFRSELSNTSETRADFKIGRSLKKLLLLASFAGMVLFLNSCVAGYVGSEPVYVESYRPAAPSNLHIWIDGDWDWNSQRHVYVQRTGNWVKPRQGHTYVAGSWQSSPNGKSWSKGHWQKDGHDNNNRR